LPDVVAVVVGLGLTVAEEAAAAAATASTARTTGVLLVEVVEIDGVERLLDMVVEEAVVVEAIGAADATEELLDVVT
jgi:hypothetical protein